MLRTNLSTRPFYNERAVHIALVAAALVIVALTALNVTRIITLSRQNTELSSRMSRDEAETERLTREASAIRRGIDKEELQIVAAAAREANALIDQRTFSWTAFFNYIEDTLPPDVMLVNVRPSVKDEQTVVTMTVLGRRVEDIDEFTEKLEATGSFENVYASQTDTTEEGLQRSLLQSVYTGPGAATEAAAAAAAAPAVQPAPSAAAPPASDAGASAAAPTAKPQAPPSAGEKK